MTGPESGKWSVAGGVICHARLCTWLRFSLVLLATFGLFFFSPSFISAFSIPSPDELRSEIRAELKRIKEKTPGAKALARWRDSRDKAEAALNEAVIQDAPEFASEPYQEAVKLFRLAKRYASSKSFKKADYLARKAAEIAHQAATEADRNRTAMEKRLLKRLQSILKRLQTIKKHVAEGTEAAENLNILFLQWGDIKNAIVLGQYSDARRALDLLEKETRQFAGRYNIILEDESEHWKETI